MAKILTTPIRAVNQSALRFKVTHQKCYKTIYEHNELIIALICTMLMPDLSDYNVEKSMEIHNDILLFDFSLNLSITSSRSTGVL